MGRLANAALLVLVVVFASAEPARAMPIVNLVIVDQRGGQATLHVELTMPDNGLDGYSFSASFSGALSFAGGQNLPPPSMGGPGTFDNGGAGPGIITLIHGLTSPPFDPVGVGAQTYTVAELTFDLNGAGGLVETGIFYPGIDGFSGPDGFSEDGEFDEAQLDAIQFGRVRLVPEPSTGLLLAAGLGALCAYQRARLGREAQRQPLGW